MITEQTILRAYANVKSVKRVEVDRTERQRLMKEAFKLFDWLYETLKMGSYSLSSSSSPKMAKQDLRDALHLYLQVSRALDQFEMQADDLIFLDYRLRKVVNQAERDLYQYKEKLDFVRKRKWDERVWEKEFYKWIDGYQKRKGMALRLLRNVYTG